MVWSLAQGILFEQHFAVPMTRRCIAVHSFGTFSSDRFSELQSGDSKLGGPQTAGVASSIADVCPMASNQRLSRNSKALGQFVLLLIWCFWDIKVLRNTEVLGLVVLALWTKIQRWLPFVRLWFLGEFLISCTARRYSVGSAGGPEDEPIQRPATVIRDTGTRGVLARSRRRRTHRGSAPLRDDETKHWATLTLQISASRRKSNQISSYDINHISLHHFILCIPILIILNQNLAVEKARNKLFMPSGWSEYILYT